MNQDNAAKSSDPFAEYVEDVYLPFILRTMKPSTYAGYSVTCVHLRLRVHHQRESERRETVRRKRHNLRNQAVLDSKNVQRHGLPGGIAGLAHITGDRWLPVGVSHNAAEATKLFGSESAFDPEIEHRFTACDHARLGRHAEGRVRTDDRFESPKVRRFAGLDVFL